ncbi:signal transduction histidine kinase [Actinopolyspora biskrensis]|uniref:histidine kinase n=1 Tax=Actinopolyspora biskrensis TaxID=1470178 RepID=A0A852Z519_9ACTN|nr:HAMP domain-containing sensor histidine kinase [Actinopolyspora biskrensis]NYH80829.1 signal transduction histidine kinase [Actinopolyspora biskrensis]
MTRSDPARPRGTRAPARVRIMAWLLLVLVVVLGTVVLLVRQHLHNQATDRVTTSLEQEVGEFARFAAEGTPSAGSSTEPEKLFRSYLSNQYPDTSEALIGVWRGPDGPRSLPQAQDDGIKRIVGDPALLRRITTSPGTSGMERTEAGPMRWARVRAVTGGEQRAWFVVARFTSEDTAQVDRIVRTLVLVSGIGVVMAAVAAWLVAGAILAPVRQVRRTAAEIGERDLTQRIPVEGRDDIAALAEQFNGMLDRLQEAFAAQREFVDDASHELRTPITIVRGNLELLGPDPEERDEVVRLCTDELDRMGRIVEDLLVLAKVDRPDFVTPERTSVLELISDIDAKVRTLGDRRWILEHIADGEVPVDPQRLTQAVVQLAQNAVQHTGKGSEIRLGCALTEGRLTLWVSDNGPGIDPAQLARIFERFAHGNERRGGAGLGLSIVRAIVDAHHGQVRVRSEGGATFEIEIPVPVPDERSEEPCS